MAEENKELLRSKHAFGSSANVESVIASGLVDAYDILFLDGDTDHPKIGWVNKAGEVVMLKENNQVITVDELPEVGQAGIIYIHNGDALIYEESEFKSLCNALTEEVINEKIDTKVTEGVESAKTEIKDKLNNYESIKYVIVGEPEGTRVDYRDKEVRIMCPSTTVFTQQSSGEGSNPDRWYLGFKAYAPEGANGFKDVIQGSTVPEFIGEDTAVSPFEGEFAGVEADGRKYVISWLPVAKRDPETDTWTYVGAQSTEEKYSGWYYLVEWYNDQNKLINSDCIRINLSNEACHNSMSSFYVKNVVDSAVVDATQTIKEYTDAQIASAFTVVEF